MTGSQNPIIGTMQRRIRGLRAVRSAAAVWGRRDGRKRSPAAAGCGSSVGSTRFIEGKRPSLVHEVYVADRSNSSLPQAENEGVTSSEFGGLLDWPQLMGFGIDMAADASTPACQEVVSWSRHRSAVLGDSSGRLLAMSSREPGAKAMRDSKLSLLPNPQSATPA